MPRERARGFAASVACDSPDGTGLICGSPSEILSEKPCLVVADGIRIVCGGFKAERAKNFTTFILRIHCFVFAVLLGGGGTVKQMWTSKGSACFKVVVRLWKRVSFMTPVHPRFLSLPPLSFWHAPSASCVTFRLPPADEKRNEPSGAPLGPALGPPLFSVLV